MAKVSARKTTRISAPPQARAPRKPAVRGALRKNAALAAQVERINDGLGAIADLLGEVQALRARFDAFAQRVEARLAARAAMPSDRDGPHEAEEIRPAPSEEPRDMTPKAGGDEDPAETDPL